jgi:hypothetical protein
LYLVPELWDDLEITECRLDVLTVTGGSPSAETGLPYKQTAIDAAAALTSAVSYWASQVDRDQEGVPESIPDAATWLVRRLDWLRMHEQAGQAYSDLRSAVSRCLVSIDRPLHSSRFPVGACPETIKVEGQGEVPCPGTIWAFVPVSDSTPAMMRCRNPECGAQWGTSEWLRAGRRILQRMGRLV